MTSHLGLLWAALFSLVLEWFARTRPKEEPGARELRPERSLAAFAVVGILCHLSACLLHSALPGFVGGVAMLVIAIGWEAFRGVRWQGFGDATDWGAVFFVAFLGSVLGPLLIGVSDRYYLPNIFDLSKHISAMISAGSSGWPGSNPYFPAKPFAYNLLFYQPWAVLARLAGGGEAYISIFAWATLWVTWQTLFLLMRFADAEGLNNPGRTLILLFATVVGGAVPWLVRSDSPLGFMLHMAGKVTFWTEDPIVTYLYLPQHVFAVTTILASVIVLFGPGQLRFRELMAGCLLSASILSSFILAPLAAIAIAVLGVALLLYGEAGASRWRSGGAFLLATGLFNAPWLLIVKSWGGKSGAIKFFLLPMASGWPWVFLSAGVVAPLAVLGLAVWWRRPNPFRTVSLILVGMGGAFVALVHFPDSDLKGCVYLRLWAMPLATVGICAIDQALRGQWQYIGRMVILVLLAQTAMIGIAGGANFLAASYRRMPPEDTQLIDFIRRLPPSTRILMTDPTDQAFAAVLTREITLDAAQFRADRYMPESDRGEVDNFFRDLEGPMLGSSAQGLAGSMDYILVSKGRMPYLWEKLGFVPVLASSNYELRRNTDFLRYRAIAKSEINLLGKNWSDWGLRGKRLSDSGALYIESEHPVDAGIVVQMALDPGYYEIQIGVKGEVYAGFSGGGDLTLFRREMLVDVPAGSYPTEYIFKTDFLISSALKDGAFEFGFGGWSQGAGKLTLTQARLWRLGRIDRP